MGVLVLLVLLALRVRVCGEVRGVRVCGEVSGVRVCDDEE